MRRKTPFYVWTFVIAFGGRAARARSFTRFGHILLPRRTAWTDHSVIHNHVGLRAHVVHSHRGLPHGGRLHYTFCITHTLRCTLTATHLCGAGCWIALHTLFVLIPFNLLLSMALLHCWLKKRKRKEETGRKRKKKKKKRKTLFVHYIFI